LPFYIINNFSKIVNNYLIINIIDKIILFILLKNNKKMKANKYKITGNKGLFDEQETQEKLSNIGNPLEK